MKKTFTLLIASLVLFSCANDTNDYTVVKDALDVEIEAALLQYSNGEGNSYFILPDNLSSIPQDPLNPLTPEKVALGRLLVHDTAMGGAPKMDEMRGTYSCASCHPVASSFYAGRSQGIGECGEGFGSLGESRRFSPNVPLDSIDIQPVRPPTLLNLAYQDVMLWNGMLGGTGTNAGTSSRWAAIPENNLGFQGIETQALVGQDAHRLLVDENFVDTHSYRTMFDDAFSNIPESSRYTRETAALAIAAYNRTLLANQAPWQDYLKGDYNALSSKEKRGAVLFTGKAMCFRCHSGPALKSDGFHAMGFGDYDNSANKIILDPAGFSDVRKGRGGFTGNSADDFKFKTPTLYNVRDAQFYGHGSSFTSLEAVIRYKTQFTGKQNPIVPDSQLAPELQHVNLTDDEVADLLFFIENSLYDPYLSRYVPESVLSGNCFPNADAASRADLGCN